MTEAAQHPGSGSHGAADEAATVGLLRAARRDEQAAALRAAEAIVSWVAQSGTDPADADRSTLAEAATVSDRFGETDVPIAGEGAPLVPDFALVGICTALGLGKHAGKNHVGNVVELAWRLPRLWEQVRAGRCALWRACRVAEHTRPLSPEAAAWIDTRIARFAGSCTPAQVERTVIAAIAACHPDQAAENAAAASEQRHVTTHLDDTSTDGVGYLDAVLDAADLLDLETAVADRAAELGRLGSADSLDVRRSQALGELARADALLEFGQVPAPESGPQPKPRRKVVLHVHLAQAALTGTSTSGLARVEELPVPVTAAQVRDWCGEAGTTIVRPVMDLSDHTPVDSYEVPDWLSRQVRERDRHCLFPFCTAPARSDGSGCDDDHIVAHDRDGPTSALNLGPLCRLHHRIKTHGGWTYVMVHPGTYLWRTRTGQHYLVDATGTHPIELG